MISNTITVIRTLFTLPLLAILALGDGAYRWSALALFLGAGAMDVLDGIVARKLGEASKFGAMLDLMGDRLLTLAAVLGLIAGGDLSGLNIFAGVILVGRCIVVACLNEALPGKLNIKVSPAEKIKIARSFLGLGLLIAPPFLPALLGRFQADWGVLALWGAALLTLFNLTDYWLRGLRAFAAERGRA